MEQLCEQARRSGMQGVEELSSVGTRGRNPKNMARDLVRKVAKNNGPNLTGLSFP